MEGAVFNGNIAVLFNKNNLTRSNCHIKPISFTTEGSDTMSYYLDGMATGKWQVTVNGSVVGTYEVVTTARFLTFTAPAGNVTLTRLT